MMLISLTESNKLVKFSYKCEIILLINFNLNSERCPSKRLIMVILQKQGNLFGTLNFTNHGAHDSHSYRNEIIEWSENCKFMMLMNILLIFWKWSWFSYIANSSRFLLWKSTDHDTHAWILTGLISKKSDYNTHELVRTSKQSISRIFLWN